MNIAITGASGFVGRHLTARLEAEGHSTRAISLRSAPPPAVLEDALEGCDAVVNLAGENIAQRWNQAAKRRIRDAGIPFRLPDRADLPERLDTVLEEIYAAFTAGWADASVASRQRARYASATG